MMSSLLLSSSAPRGLRLFPLLLLFVSSASSLKFLGYNPIFAHSHSNFIGKIADTLIDAGHEVVLLTPIINNLVANRTSKHARLIMIPPNDANQGYGEVQADLMGRQLWKTDSNDVFMMINPVYELSARLSSQCETTLTTPGVLAQLQAEHFDAAFSECFDQCGFGIFNLLGIDKYAVTYSMSIMDGFFRATGAPSPPSYVPRLLSPEGDEMTMKQRFWNLLANVAISIINGRITSDGQAVFDRLHPGRPPLLDIVHNSTYFFINSEPLVDFPQPSVAKMVFVGGIAVPPPAERAAFVLPPEMLKLLAARPHTVYISFGSVMMASFMPSSFKEAIRSAARLNPEVTFIWKYETPEDGVADGLDNLVPIKWLPQLELLNSGRLSAFLTHAGAGSAMEAMAAGVPIVAVPVMADQMRNGAMIRRLGSGVTLDKSALSQRDTVARAVARVIEDKRFSTRAREVAAMLADQPEPPRARLVSHFEFMARHGPLRLLDHHARLMGWIDYYNLDILAILVLALSALSVVAFLAIRWSLKMLRLNLKTKKE